jgi:hypothetical protein
MNEIFDVIKRCVGASGGSRGIRAAYVPVSEDSKCVAIIHHVINNSRVTSSRAASIIVINRGKVIHDSTFGSHWLSS